MSVPTIEFAGAFLLKMVARAKPDTWTTPSGKIFYGRAHVGVNVIPSLICRVLVDLIILPTAFA